MEITVVIVDDDKYIPDNLKKIVEGYQSIYHNEGVTYKVIQVFKEIFAFAKAKEYILDHQEDIDILLIDYHLTRGLGTDLFALIKKEYKIYRILHSQTDNSLDESQEELSNKIYDHFCRTKEPEKIHESFEKFEKNILDIKLYGNRPFRDRNFINLAKLNLASNLPTFAGINLFDILYAQSIGNDQITICFRDFNTKKIDFRTRTGKRLPFFTNSQFHFKSINTQTVINLLWVAKIDTSVNTIRFITLDNIVCELSYTPSPTIFDTEIKPLISDIGKNIPLFLKD